MGSAVRVAGEPSHAVRRVLNDQSPLRARGVGERERGRIVHHAKRVLNDNGGSGVGQAQRSGIDAEGGGRNLGIDRREPGYQNRVNGGGARECLRHHGPARRARSRERLEYREHAVAGLEDGKPVFGAGAGLGGEPITQGGAGHEALSRVR